MPATGDPDAEGEGRPKIFIKAHSNTSDQHGKTQPTETTGVKAPHLELDDREEALMHPKRFMIATLLYLTGTMEAGQLQRSTGMGWGELDSHLRRMEARGLVVRRKTLTLRGPRSLVRLTGEGRRAYESLASKLRKLLEEVG